nr:hypothetical protein [Tanacetum cinerariifolium]
MRELREDTFFGNKNDNAHEHVEQVLDIVSLFNIPGVSHDVVMLRVFPITLTGAAKRKPRKRIDLGRELADEYKLGIRKKGHMLDDIWKNYRKVQGDNTYWWHDQKSEEEERRKLGINVEEYDPPMVHVENFKVKRYSFDTGQSFICVTKELMDALQLGRENGSRFKGSLYEEMKFEVSSTRFHVVERFCIGVTTKTISTQDQKPQRKARSGSKFSSNNLTLKPNLSKFQSLRTISA